MPLVPQEGLISTSRILSQARSRTRILQVLIVGKPFWVLQICHPLRNLDMIKARADAVQELAGSLSTSAMENKYPGSGRGGGGNAAAAAAAAEGNVGGLAGEGKKE